MSASVTTFQLPQQNIPVVDANGRVTLQWFRFFQQLGVSGDPSGAIAALEAEVATLATEVATAENQAAQALTDASEALDAASAGQALGAIALKQAASPLKVAGSGLATSGASSITFAGSGATVSHEGGDVTVTVPATVYSVGLSAPAQFSVSGSPVATSGTLNFSWNTQTANAVLAGPGSGAATAPTFRALVAADIPSTLNSTTIEGSSVPNIEITDGTNNQYIAGITSAGQLFTDTALGDCAIRCNNGSIRLGVGTGSTAANLVVNSYGIISTGYGDFITNLTGGVGIRMRADSTNTEGILQFTNYAASAQWSQIICNAPGSLVFADNTGASMLSVTDSMATISGAFKSKVYTVSTLPSASSAGVGARAFVSDATSGAFYAAPVGGGAYFAPVFSNGTSWYIG